MKNTKLNTLKSDGVLSDDTQSLDKYSFSNLFNVVNKGEKSYFNICKGIQIDTTIIDPSLFSVHVISSSDTWSNISYRYYKTYKLWWLICKFNNVKNPFEELIVGKYIMIPSENIVTNILELIGN